MNQSRQSIETYVAHNFVSFWSLKLFCRQNALRMQIFPQKLLSARSLKTSKGIYKFRNASKFSDKGIKKSRSVCFSLPSVKGPVELCLFTSRLSVVLKKLRIRCVLSQQSQILGPIQLLNFLAYSNQSGHKRTATITDLILVAIPPEQINRSCMVLGVFERIKSC